MTRIQFMEKHPTLYSWLIRNKKNLLDKFFPRTLRKKFTKECCVRDAKNYKSRGDWALSSQSIYNAARRNGWTEECCKHMSHLHRAWDKKQCIEEAKKYETRALWALKSLNSYNAARRNGWFKECCKHMGPGHGKRRVKNLDDGQVYYSITEASVRYKLKSRSSIITAIKTNRKAGGYRWAYCDENGNVID